MTTRLLKNKIPMMVVAGTAAVFAYLLLGGPLPGPVGEQYGTYLGALFGAVPSAHDVRTLVFRSTLIFLAAFSLSWLALTWLEPRRQVASAGSGD